MNPSYDKTLPISTRLADFLGEYHISLNGVVAHDPFMLTNEDKPNVRCDDDHKKKIVDFVDQATAQARKDVLEKIDVRVESLERYIKSSTFYAEKLGFELARDTLLELRNSLKNENK